ncbi:MAG TPA: type II toxin-antitoxin system mRNA interferase toxin, RelE/StbE family [Methylomirabilota bacterium]|nr:type II toxin-antitoxin system mRNA interferase toxin, RelE/StbE family [Methylomirabilota bacterium]
MNLVWSAKFTRAVKRVAGRDKKLLSEIERTLTQLAADSKHTSLRTHKLKGELAGTWSCSVSYDLRILFDFVKNPKTSEVEIFLLTIGTHDEVY